MLPTQLGRASLLIPLGHCRIKLDRTKLDPPKLGLTKLGLTKLDRCRPEGPLNPRIRNRPLSRGPWKHRVRNPRQGRWKRRVRNRRHALRRRRMLSHHIPPLRPDPNHVLRPLRIRHLRRDPNRILLRRDLNRGLPRPRIRTPRKSIQVVDGFRRGGAPAGNLKSDLNGARDRTTQSGKDGLRGRRPQPSRWRGRLHAVRAAR